MNERAPSPHTPELTTHERWQVVGGRLADLMLAAQYVQTETGYRKTRTLELPYVLGRSLVITSPVIEDVAEPDYSLTYITTESGRTVTVTYDVVPGRQEVVTDPGNSFAQRALLFVDKTDPVAVSAAHLENIYAYLMEGVVLHD